MCYVYLCVHDLLAQEGQAYDKRACAWNASDRLVSLAPVSAATTTSVPAAIAGIARDWMPVPVEKPRLPSAVTTAGCIAGMSANGVASSPVAAAVTPGDTSPAAAAAAAGGKRRRKGTTSRVEKRRRGDRLSDAEGQRATVKAPAAAVVDG